jgi:hypothetical protein
VLGAIRRFVRLVRRRLNLFDVSRTDQMQPGNVSGPTVPRDTSGGGF